MSERKDDNLRSPHLDVNEDKMYDSRIAGNYDLHDLAHSTVQDRRSKVSCTERTTRSRVVRAA